jgi:rhamnosyltransferase
LPPENSEREDSVRIAAVVPIRDPGPVWNAWLDAYASQTLEPDRLIVLDSSNDDRAAAAAKRRGAKVLSVVPTEYDHGGTRRRGVAAAGDVQAVILMTHDAVLAERHTLERLVAPLKATARVGASFGRQLPWPTSGPIAAHSRYYNYPAASRTTGLADVPSLGMKAAFISNALACYRMSALEAVGGFPTRVLFGEDAIVAARLVLAQWMIAYAADATTYHCHDYSIAREARRYFDIGVLHAQEPWIQAHLGGAAGEGARYVRSEILYLARRAPHLLPQAVLRTVAKLSTYRVGLRYASLPTPLCSRLSLNPTYWRGERPHDSNRNPPPGHR